MDFKEAIANGSKLYFVLKVQKRGHNNSVTCRYQVIDKEDNNIFTDSMNFISEKTFAEMKKHFSSQLEDVISYTAGTFGFIIVEVGL